MPIDLSVAAARAESDEKFREQFNPESKVHHGGNKEKAPCAHDIERFGAGAFGSGKIPESMKGMPEVVEYVEPPKIEYGEEYDNIMAERGHLNKLKSAINKVTASVGVMLTDLTNTTFVTNRDKAVEELRSFITFLGKENQWSKEIEVICTEAVGSEEELAKKIHEMANSTNRAVFAYNKKMLNRVKEIKKEALQKTKAEEKQQ